MAKKPTKASGSRISNIMGLIRGNFEFKNSDATDETLSFGSPEIISLNNRTRLLSGIVNNTPSVAGQKVDAAGIMGIVQSSLSRVGTTRLENRKILSLMPEVAKAARLMIASTFAPNDLKADNINITIDLPQSVDESVGSKVNEFATDFFQTKLNLKTQAPKWVYQFGYETGASVFAIVPLRSFEKIEAESYVGTEDFIAKVVDPVSSENVFGFGDDGRTRNSSELIGLESLATEIITSDLDPKDRTRVPPRSDAMRKVIDSFIGQEALKLTDNPSILQVNEVTKNRTSKRNANVLSQRYRKAVHDPIVNVSVPKKDEENLYDPILMRLPPESVTVIHTPGDPNDHQGYLVLLDRQGNPINAVMMEEEASALSSNNYNSQNNLFNQVYTAYGINNRAADVNKIVMQKLYNQVVGDHLRERVNKAGYTNVEIASAEPMLRCMFTRMLQQKQTRVLFLPKELVTYMTYEVDQNGYGVSRLEGAKFNLGMKMAVQVSRTLAAIKASMDRRQISVKFTDNLLEHPETVLQSVIGEYLKKSTISFSTDPNVIQNQIADKSLSIKGIDMPGFEQFELTNEPDQRTASVDFDPNVLEYMDKSINNALRVPSATMNTLSEDEYARSVTTTNLFFAMDVAMDQDIVKKLVSDLIRKYARFSQSFSKGIYKLIPNLNKGASNSSTDETVKVDSKESFELPEGYNLDELIDSMSITLPHPNVAPSKAQFEALSAMIQSIGEVVDAMFPDDLAGSNDSLAPTIRLLRAKFKAMNIRTYLESSGMTSIEIPENDFSEELAGISKLTEGLQNVAAMLEQKAKLVAPKEEPLPGY